MNSCPRVLVLTGGYLSYNVGSTLTAILKQFLQWKFILKFKAKIVPRRFRGFVPKFLTYRLIEAQLTTWGGNIATLEAVFWGQPFRILFTHVPRPQRGSHSVSYYLVPAPYNNWMLRPLVSGGHLIIMALILGGDRKILDKVTPISFKYAKGNLKLWIEHVENHGAAQL